MSVIDHQEIIRIILSFRVNELKLLLGDFNLNRYGLKSDLQERAVSLVEHPNLYPAVRKKVLKLQETRLGNTFDRSSIASADSNSNDSNSEMSHPAGLLNYFPMPNVNEFVEGIKNASNTGDEIKQTSSRNSIRATFKVTPFFQKLSEIIKPQLLEKCTTMRYQELNFSFKFTCSQASRITLNRNIANAQQNPIQVHIRFSLMNSNSELEDCLPNSLGVKVNNRLMAIPSTCTSKNQNPTDFKKPTRPIDITPFLKLSPVATNTVTISYVESYPANPATQFCFTIQLVKRLEAKELLDRLVSSGTSDPLETRNLVIEKLRGDDESEILSSSLKCKLACPLGKMRIQIPIRGKLCKHIQCFDALLYLKMNEKKSTWICPICDQKAEYHHLFVDGYFNDILTNASSDCDEVEFLPDGSWKRLPKTSAKSLAPSEEPVIKKQKVECDVITLDSDDDDIPSPVPSSNKSLSSNSAPPPSIKDNWFSICNFQEEPEVISLD